MTTFNPTNNQSLCPNCKSDLTKLRFTQVQVHLHIDNILFPGVADYVKQLKAKNQLNRVICSALIQFKDSPTFDFLSVLKSLDRIETVMSISSDSAAFLSVSKELELLKSHFKSKTT